MQGCEGGLGLFTCRALWLSGAELTNAVLRDPAVC